MTVAGQHLCDSRQQSSVDERICIRKRNDLHEQRGDFVENEVQRKNMGDFFVHRDVCISRAKHEMPKLENIGNESLPKFLVGYMTP